MFDPGGNKNHWVNPYWYFNISYNWFGYEIWLFTRKPLQVNSAYCCLNFIQKIEVQSMFWVEVPSSLY